MGEESAEGERYDSEGNFDRRDVFEETREVVLRAQLESLAMATRNGQSSA